MRAVLAGEPGAVRDIVLLNAAAGLVAFELSQDAEQVQRPILERLADAARRAAAAASTPAPPRRSSTQWVAATNA